MKNITITVDGVDITVPKGTVLAQVLHHDHVAVSMPCGGKGTCGKCRVVVAGAVSQPAPRERELLSAKDLERGVRLACMTYAEGNCVVQTLLETPQEICTDATIEQSLTDTLAIPMFERYGVAVDIGTTTVAACLYGREWEQLAVEGRSNPQSVWGADVMSRMEKATEGSAKAMARVVTELLDEMICSLAQGGNILPHDIDALVITGNTVMLHLLTQTPVVSMMQAPFDVKEKFGIYTTAEHLHLTAVTPTTKVYLMPCISAFVGGDLVSALMASDFCHGEQTKLLTDIGTNGEMALWHNQKLYVCSTAAGPAFEGAGISMGMTGSKGAISGVDVVNGRMYAKVMGDIQPQGICGSGLIDVVACLLDLDMMDEQGVLEVDPTPIAPPVVLTQADVRAVQVAKSAIHAGLLTLMHQAGVTVDDISVLYMAGGFGSYLNLSNAGKIGLIPKALVGRTKVLGNVALAGAGLVLLDEKCGIEQAKKITRIAQKTELATHPYFVEKLMEKMSFLP